ncbi:MAG TPA: hypothetical protein VJS44_07765 [Pyrinomonadaceae bacterium]|nr:hypothetical protein [Pyrinomonadaceae bacterium]
MQRGRRRLIGAAFVVAMIVVPSVLAVRFYRHKRNEPLAVGSVMPALEVRPVNGADTLGQKGRHVLLFFSPACSDCGATLTQLEQLRERHADWFRGERALKWSLISISGDDETKAFAETKSWPVYQDARYGATVIQPGESIPYLILVDESGSVRHRHSGERTTEQLEELLDKFFRTGAV